MSQKSLEERVQELEDLVRQHKEMLSLQIKINISNIEMMQSLSKELREVTEKQRPFDYIPKYDGQ